MTKKIQGANKLFLYVIAIFLTTTLSAYEESSYDVVYESDLYEVRFYEERLVVQTSYGNEDNGFMKLFRYISGSNKNSEKIAMTTPVTQSNTGENMVMQFYLPSVFDKSNTPQPDDNSVEISSIKAGYFAAIKYSGRSSERNFKKHSKILKEELKENKVVIMGPPIKATYNGPFTLPPFRRNEAMYLVDWK